MFFNFVMIILKNSPEKRVTIKSNCRPVDIFKLTLVLYPYPCSHIYKNVKYIKTEDSFNRISGTKFYSCVHVYSCLRLFICGESFVCLIVYTYALRYVVETQRTWFRVFFSRPLVLLYIEGLTNMD